MNSERHAESVGVIGGADGPTGIFISGKNVKVSLKNRIRVAIRKCRRNRAEKKIEAGAHTLDELVLYAEKIYGAIKDDSGCSRYIIKTDKTCIELDIDRNKDFFGASFTADKKNVKDCRKIVKDLYLYYGVSEKDIIEKTQRYFSLLSVMSM